MTTPGRVAGREPTRTDAEYAESILGYQVTRLSLPECLDRILDWIEAGEKGKYLACLNPHSIEVARRDSAFARALHEADLAIPDGVGMLIASRILGGCIRRRITGSDIFAGLHRLLDARGGRSVYFLGSTDATLADIVTRMHRDYPNVRVAGTYSPPFRETFSAEDSAAMIDAINAARPDVLWVGMTAPKQEKWVREHRDRLDVAFIGPVGAVFDFFTGRVRRSSPLFQRAGLEWLPRLLQEPRRLWRRNFISNPRFLCRVVAARFALEQNRE